MTELAPEVLEALRQMSSCTIANAIETFDIRPRNEGVASSKVRCMFPDMGSMIGYAVTGVIAADSPPTPRMNVPRTEWFDEVLRVPEPRVLVMHDLSHPDPVGSFWGEVQANVHKALGCVGTVTDGGVRDLDEMCEAGFFAFASAALVSHAYVHLVDVNVQITIGGLIVNPGDLIMGDKHGVVSIPKEVAADIPDAVEAIEKRERTIIELCRSPEFSLEKLKDLYSR